MNAKHNQGIWFRIGKRSNNYDDKLLKHNLNENVKSKKYQDFRDRVYNINAKHNQGIWFRIGKI